MKARKDDPRTARRGLATIDEGQIVYLPGDSITEYVVVLIANDEQTALVEEFHNTPSGEYTVFNLDATLREGLGKMKIVALSDLRAA